MKEKTNNFFDRIELNPPTTDNVLGIGQCQYYNMNSWPQ